MINLFKSCFIIYMINSLPPSSGTIITNVNFLFETFTPSNLIRFFEFTDKEWKLNENCVKDMYQYLEGLQKGSVWAIRLYDSTGYYGGAGFSGYKFRISNPQQCRQLHSEYLSFSRKYWSLRSNLTSIPFPVQLISAKYEIEMATKLFEVYEIQQSICFPKSCKYQDLQEILSTNHFRSNHIVQNVTLKDFRILTGNFNIFDDVEFYILISIICTSMTLLICAHFSDFWSFSDEDDFDQNIDNRMIKDNKEDEKNSLTLSLPSELNEKKDSSCKILDNCTKLSKSIVSNKTGNGNTLEEKKNSVTKLNMHPFAESMTINNMNSNNHVNLVKVKKVSVKNMSTISLDILAGNCDYANSLPKSIDEKNNLIQEFLSAFSLQSNYDNFVKCTPEHEISTLRGLQFLCSISMILANICIAMDFISNNQIIRKTNSLDFITMSRNYSSYLIDSFFFLSGANLSHLYFKTNCKNSLEIVEQLLHFVGMIAHKICGLIFPYIIIMICLELGSKHFHENVAVEIPSIDHRTCDTTKWRNILFIDTFFPVEERCMPWSWFISIEVQFFFAACLVLLLAQIHPRYAGAICTGLFVACLMASVIVEMQSIPLEVNLWKNFEQDLADFNLIFDKIWLRIPPYLLGMCLGYILYKTQGKLEMNIFVIVFGWIACFLIIIGFIFGFQMILQQLNSWIRAMIVTLTHTIWAMILFWIVLASISQYGGLIYKILTSNFFHILGKLSNCTFLLSPLLIRILILNSESGVYSSNIHTIVMFFGISVLSFAFSLLLHLLFEAPLMALLKMIYKYRNN